jgi:hypothetical protein
MKLYSSYWNIFQYGEYLFNEVEGKLFLCASSSVSFTALDLCEQQMNVEADEVCEIAKNCFGKCLYCIGILMSLL